MRWLILAMGRQWHVQEQLKQKPPASEIGRNDKNDKIAIQILHIKYFSCT